MRKTVHINIERESTKIARPGFLNKFGVDVDSSKWIVYNSSSGGKYPTYTEFDTEVEANKHLMYRYDSLSEEYDTSYKTHNALGMLHLYAIHVAIWGIGLLILKAFAK
jgi:hypothetical protein